jgi:hypothetical protein
MQGVFSPVLDEQLGSLSSKHHQLAAILSIVKVELLAGVWPGGVGPFIQAPRASLNAQCAALQQNRSRCIPEASPTSGFSSRKATLKLAARAP